MSAPRTVIVTGSASGIGEETCRRLVRQGDTVVGLDVAQGEFVAHTVDVRDEDAVRLAVDQTVQDHGALDVLCNVAGIGASGDVTANSLDEWRHVFDVNVLGTVNCSRAAIPHMRRSGGGCIVNVSSVVALIGLTDRALYSATKGAVSALTRAMAADHVHEGIRVNAVCPGTVDTPWVRRQLAATSDPERLLERLRLRQPMGRLGKAEEVAAAIVYLASEEAGFVTGTELVVDGGLSGLLAPRSPRTS
jgi:2-keto-3-deoxy-L-fuconate dehydrogenase